MSNLHQIGRIISRELALSLFFERKLSKFNLFVEINKKLLKNFLKEEIGIKEIELKKGKTKLEIKDEKAFIFLPFVPRNEDTFENFITILWLLAHEIGHLWQVVLNLPPDENEANEFAYEVFKGILGLRGQFKKNYI